MNIEYHFIGTVWRSDKSMNHVDVPCEVLSCFTMRPEGDLAQLLHDRLHSQEIQPGNRDCQGHRPIDLPCQFQGQFSVPIPVF